MAKYSSSGSRELEYNFKLNMSKANQSLDDFAKKLKNFGIDPAGMNGFTIAQGRMTKAMRESLLESERLRQENTRLRNEYEQGRITAQQLAAQTRALNEQRRAEAAALREARRNQVAANGSYNEARQRLAAMRREIFETTNGFTQMGRAQNARIEDYRRLNSQLAEFDRRMGNQRGGSGQNALQGLQGMAATYITGAAILSGGRKVLDMNIELSDSLSDVQRTAGLTASEAENLANQLKKIDTRTSLKGLVDIAVIGGQLGIAKEQLAGFTTAVNQLAVSLGGELQGGAEGIAKSLGVLDNVFKITQGNGGNVEKSLNQIGSAILGLGQSGQATGDFLADFGERVGGLGKQFGLSLPVILSYGAVLQENGVSAEVAGSSFKRLVSSLISNRGKFLAVAQISDSTQTLSSFTNLINTDLKKALDLFFDGLSKGGTKNSAFNDTLKALRLTGGGVSQAIAAIADNQAKLNEHVQDATKDFNDASLAAEQYAIKNDNLAGSWDKLGNTIRNAFTSGPVAGFFKVLIDGLNDATKKLIGITQSRSWMEFFTRITPFANTKGFDINNQIADNFKAGTSTSYDLNSIYDKQQRGEQVGILELQKAYGDALAATKSALKDYQNFEKGLKSRDLKNTNGQLGTLATRFRYLRDQTKYFTDEYNKAKGKLPKEALATDGDITIPGSDKAAKAEARRLETALTGQRALQFKIDELTQKGLDKQLSANDQEVAAVKMKYAKMIEEAIKFNNSSKNKSLGLKVNTSGLVRAEKEEVAAVVYSQDTTGLKNTLEEQKKLYADYESFKDKVGESAANSRYAKLINTDRTYLAKLQEQYAITVAQGFANGFTGDVNNRLTFLNKAMKDETDIAEKKYQALLTSLVSYEQNKAGLIKKYETNRAAAVARGDLEAVTVLDKIHKDALAGLEDENVQKLSAFKELFSGIDNMSADAAKRVIGNAKAMLKALELKGVQISPELKKQIEEALKGATKSLTDKIPEDIKRIGGELQNLAGIIGDVDSGFGMWVNTLGGTLGNIGQLKDQISQIQNLKKGDVLGGISAGLGAASTVFAIGKSLEYLFNAGERKRAEQSKYAGELQAKQNEAVIKALDRQLSLINQVYGTEKLVKYAEAVKSIETAADDAQKKLSSMYRLSGNKELDEIIERLNNGSATRNDKSLEAYNQAKFDVYRIGNASLEELQRLLDYGDALGETATRYAQSLIDLKQKAIDAANAVKEALTGTSFQSLSDSIVDAITSGAAAGSQNFENIMRKAIIESLKTKEYTAEIQKFYDDFTNASKSGLDDAKIALLKAQYDKIIADGTKAAENLGKVTGVNLSSGNTASTSNAISRAQLTEETGSRLEGIQRAQLDATKLTNGILTPMAKSMVDTYLVARDSFNQIVRIEAHTFRTANNTERLQAIEASLSTIAANTKPTVTPRGQGI